jgi:hypothetical protein
VWLIAASFARIDRMVLISAVLGNIHDLADFPIVFSFDRPLQNLALGRREDRRLVGEIFLLARSRARLMPR